MNTDKHGSTQDERKPMALPLRRLVIATIGACLVLAIGMKVYNVLQPEPTWNGRRLSNWLQDLRANAPQSGANQDQAEAAVRVIGTNGIPFLLGWINAEDSPAKKAIYGNLPRKLQIRWQPQWAFDRQWMAATAFVVLGTNGEPAVIELSRLLGSGKRGRAAAAALGGIGPKAFPVLTNLLAQESTSADAAFGLTKFGDMALPVFLQALLSTNRAVHQAAFAGLHFCVYNQYIWLDPNHGSRAVRGSMLFDQSNIGVAMAAHSGREKNLLAQALDRCLVSTNQEVTTAARLLKSQLGL